MSSRMGLVGRRFAGARMAAKLSLVAMVAGFLAACNDNPQLRSSGRSTRPIPSQTLALMQQKGTNAQAPMLIRTFKKEAELEIWKMKADGQYALLKTYPMCRWSGQLGPKTKEGDRQVPEGFYAITPSQMNPNSNYYLSFNVGYPNAFDKAHGYTGGLIMVHGDCSSAGCFSMTDEQIAEIYAIARESFAGGQKAIQLQSMPFRMTADNLAKHRLDPNMKFWKDIKVGNDHFEVTKQEVAVGVCNRRYVFNAVGQNGARLDPTAACPPLQEDQQLKSVVARKDHDDQQKVAELVGKGVKPIKIVYADGGQHPDFQHVERVSRPDALARGPVEIELDDKGAPVPSIVKIAAAKQAAGETAVARAEPAPAARPAETRVAASVPAATAPATPTPVANAFTEPTTTLYSGLMGGISSIGQLISGTASSKDAPAPAQTAAAPAAAAPAPARSASTPPATRRPSATPAPAAAPARPKPQASAQPRSASQVAQAPAQSPYVQVGNSTYARVPSPASLR
jgi:murein L,D-transpeptidase YafK